MRHLVRVGSLDGVAPMLPHEGGHVAVASE